MAAKTMNVRGQRLERATAIRALALRLIQEMGQEQVVGGAVKIVANIFEDDRFRMMFYVMPAVPIETCRRFGIEPRHFGLYALELWDKHVGKVLNLSWESMGVPPRIVTFGRGEWEDLLLRSFRQLR